MIKKKPVKRFARGGLGLFADDVDISGEPRDPNAARLRANPALKRPIRKFEIEQLDIKTKPLPTSAGPKSRKEIEEELPARTQSAGAAKKRNKFEAGLDEPGFTFEGKKYKVDDARVRKDQADDGMAKGGRVRAKHPGFKSVQASIAKRQGISKDRAGAILAASTRKASPAARKANPRLNRVKGK